MKAVAAVEPVEAETPSLPPMVATAPAAAAKPNTAGPESIGERRPAWTRDELALLAKGSNKIPVCI